MANELKIIPFDIDLEAVFVKMSKEDQEIAKVMNRYFKKQKLKPKVFIVSTKSKNNKLTENNDIDSLEKNRRIKIEDSKPNENGNGKILPKNQFIGLSIIKKPTKNGFLNEIWQNDPNEKDPKNHWKLITSWNEKPEPLRPIWITVDEWLADPDKWKGKNYHIKSKPTNSPIFINKDGDICYTHFDEYDHAMTIRMDNPDHLNIEQAQKMFDSVKEDCKKEIEENKKHDIQNK